MNEQRLDTFSAYSGTSAVERNRVLRNTYWLLAITMVPTILGAWHSRKNLINIPQVKAQRKDGVDLFFG